MPKSGSTPHEYDEAKIKTLSSLEHIRLRTGMYIGRIGDGTQYDDGIYVLVKEVVDNGIDEHIMGHGDRVELTVDDDGTVTVRDYGRGIPLGKVVECVSRINTGAKYNDDVFQFSVGLNGVGTKAVNALSREFTVRSHRDGQFVEARFRQGVLQAEKRGRCPGEADGTWVRFVPDPEIFGGATFVRSLLLRRIRFYTYLNAGLRIVLNGEDHVSNGGLLDLIRDETDADLLYPPFHHRDRMLEFAFTHTNSFSEDHYSFVNGQFTTDGGAHLSAFREGILKGVNEFAKGKYEGDDVREGLVGAVAIRLKDPVFESQTKNKLGNAEIRAPLVTAVRDAVSDLLHRAPGSAQTLIAKIEETRELRQQLQSVKKMARERARSVTVRIAQLRDCKVHLNRRRGLGRESMIFITEGQSAAGSLVSCRNPNTQAVFTLKGKPLNVCELKRDALYRNEEIYGLMRGLNIEDSVEDLRYQHVILATDADVDGLHIRNLLITFFLKFFQSLVSDGHLRILETPLFRVRNPSRTLYCYSERERDEAVRALSGRHEITRFKGLGEISPHEFKAFIGPDMRLTPVDVRDEHSIESTLAFYMGRNTQERRAYIMAHLIVEDGAGP